MTNGTPVVGPAGEGLWLNAQRFRLQDLKLKDGLMWIRHLLLAVLCLTTLPGADRDSSCCGGFATITDADTLVWRLGTMAGWWEGAPSRQLAVLSPVDQSAGSVEALAIAMTAYQTQMGSGQAWEVVTGLADDLPFSFLIQPTLVNLHAAGITQFPAPDLAVLAGVSTAEIRTLAVGGTHIGVLASATDVSAMRVVIAALQSDDDTIEIDLDVGEDDVVEEVMSTSQSSSPAIEVVAYGSRYPGDVASLADDGQALGRHHEWMERLGMASGTTPAEHFVSTYTDPVVSDFHAFVADVRALLARRTHANVTTSIGRRLHAALTTVDTDGIAPTKPARRRPQREPRAASPEALLGPPLGSGYDLAFVNNIPDDPAVLLRLQITAEPALPEGQADRLLGFQACMVVASAGVYPDSDLNIGTTVFVPTMRVPGAKSVPQSTPIERLSNISVGSEIIVIARVDDAWWPTATEAAPPVLRLLPPARSLLQVTETDDQEGQERLSAVWTDLELLTSATRGVREGSIEGSHFHSDIGRALWSTIQPRNQAF